MIKGEVTVIRRPADDVETRMNIQRRNSAVFFSLCVFVCAPFAGCASATVRTASWQLCEDFVFTADLQKRSFIHLGN